MHGYMNIKFITRALSKIYKRNSVCESMLVDSTWLVGWPIDRSSSVVKKKSVLKLMDRTVYAGFHTYIFIYILLYSPPDSPFYVNQPKAFVTSDVTA